MILAIDIGTSSAKAGLFSEDGRCAKSVTAHLPRAAAPEDAASEVEPAAWLAAARDLAAALLAGAGRPDCLVLSGNGPTIAAVDRGGRPLGTAITWMDRRAAAEAAEASAAAGQPIDQGFRLPRALWIKRNRPADYGRAAFILSCPEFLGMALTGRPATIVPAGYEARYGEAPAIAALGLDPEKFPPSAGPGLPLGPISAAGEAAIGLAKGIPVVLAGPDYLAAIAGAAATRPGRACDRAGTSEGINLCSAQGVRDERLFSVPHLARPYANVSGTISTTGEAVAWIKAALGREAESYEEFLASAAASPPGASGLVFLPYLAGERCPLWDPSARGAFLGLSLSHSGDDLARAVVESTAFAMRDVIEVMEEAGAPVAELRVVGKPGRSAAWNQIKADVTGRPIWVPECADPELQGDACFGLVALGRFSSIAEAAEATVRMARPPREPDPALRGLYDELFGVYREAYAALKPLYGKLESARRRPSVL